MNYEIGNFPLSPFPFSSLFLRIIETEAQWINTRLK
jgi:hypothetical protein